MLKIVPIVLSVAVMLGFVAPECEAQAASQVRALLPGARVRLEWSLPQTRQSLGTAVEVGSTGFLFQPASGESPRQVQFSDLNRLEVSTGRKSNWRFGLLIGLIGGAVAGYVIVPDRPGDIDPRPFGVAAGGLAGGIVGLVIGSAVTSERWAAVAAR